MATAAAAALTIPQAYGWVVVAASAMGFTATALGAGIGGARKKLFGKDFDERADVKAIKDEIKKAFPDHKPIADGYPDMGSGLFARLLKPAEWYEFNLAQRAHHNTLENLTFAITMVLTAGLFQPEAAAACGVVFCIGRVMLARGYTRLGPNGRFPGGPISMIPMMGLLGVNLFYGFKHGLAAAGLL
ncbi:hypothetical protein FNF28_01664 [Cafeteria roenbergensis]|uniref:MAPEG family protein n=1 Tax=Cafeteria roenbergensis TaxID=33653 RepID=A0A5A8DX28_CAFRO|nr:hypothetical protein FNF28_01664 [Cafeteria roenbergensis]